MLAVDLLLLRLLVWLRPATDIDAAPDYAAAEATLGQAGAPPADGQRAQRNGEVPQLAERALGPPTKGEGAKQLIVGARDPETAKRRNCTRPRQRREPHCSDS